MRPYLRQQGGKPHRDASAARLILTLALAVLTAWSLLSGCAAAPTPNPCSGFRQIATKDAVVWGSQTWAQIENEARTAAKQGNEATIQAFFDRQRDVLTTDTARAIVAHNEAWARFCRGVG